MVFEASNASRLDFIRQALAGRKLAELHDVGQAGSPDLVKKLQLEV